MIPPAPWRVVIVTRILPVALAFHTLVRDAGHEPVALLTIRDSTSRYGPDGVYAHLDEVPPELDVLLPSRRAAVAPMLESVQPDLVLCTGFPWKVPAAALAVPPLGWLNGHPSLLPRHRGPVPIAWAIREGDKEVGWTVHRMDAALDTGPILVQKRFPIGDYVEPDEFYGRMGPPLLDSMREALELLAAGERGTVQEDGDYQSFYGGEDELWLDFGRPASDVHRQVWAWRYTMPGEGTVGALAKVDGKTVRVLASSLTEVEGAERVTCADAPLWLVRTEPFD